MLTLGTSILVINMKTIQRVQCWRMGDKNGHCPNKIMKRLLL